jgi:hypothetical protein
MRNHCIRFSSRQFTQKQFQGISFLSQKRIEESPLTLIGEFAAVLVLLLFLVVGLVMPGSHHFRGRERRYAGSARGESKGLNMLEDQLRFDDR